MENTTNVIIVSEGRPLNTLSSYLSEKSEYKVMIAPRSAEEMNKLVSSLKKAVVIIDYYEEYKAYLLELLTRLKKHGFKYIMICASVKEGFGFLSQGIDEIITRPKDLTQAEKKAFFTIMEMKIEKLVQDYSKDKRAIKNKYMTPINKIIAIGSSTGGTDCIEKILKMLPEDTPPVLIVQHMPPVFTELFSQRLNTSCKMTVLEAIDGDALENGKVLIAPGDKQMRLEYKNGRYFVSCKKEGQYGGHEPSVDVLFNSVAEHGGKKAIGVILTGMGKDGAQGLLKMRETGAFTIGQDEASSIVYGMPKAAYDIGAVMTQGDPYKIARLIMEH